MLEIVRCKGYTELHVHAVHLNTRDPVVPSKPSWTMFWLSGENPDSDAGSLTVKDAYLQLIELLDRVAKQCGVLRIVAHSRSLANGLQKQLNLHGYCDVGFGGFGVLRLEKICRHPAISRAVICVAAGALPRGLEQWYVTTCSCVAERLPVTDIFGGYANYPGMRTCWGWV